MIERSTCVLVVINILLSFISHLKLESEEFDSILLCAIIVVLYTCVNIKLNHFSYKSAVHGLQEG